MSVTPHFPPTPTSHASWKSILQQRGGNERNTDGLESTVKATKCCLTHCQARLAHCRSIGPLNVGVDFVGRGSYSHVSKNWGLSVGLYMPACLAGCLAAKRGQKNNDLSVRHLWIFISSYETFSECFVVEAERGGRKGEGGRAVCLGRVTW